MKDARHLEAIYHSLALRMRKTRTGHSKLDVNYVLNELSKQFPLEDECESNFLPKSFDNGNFVKMMLRNMQMEKYPSTVKTLRGNRAVWWEHILPKNPGKDSEWKKVFEDEKERMEYVGRLGNHTLLFGPTDRKLSNKDFSEKKKKYKDSELELTQEIAEYDKWDKGTIEERTRKLFELSKQVWPIY